MYDRLQFAELYSRLADDELARIALENQLVPEAHEALAVELQKRGLNDLSEYKRNFEEAAAASSVETGQAPIERPREEWLFAFAACLMAILLPLQFEFAGLPHLDRVELALGALFIAFSCFLGLRARRKGSHKGFLLKFVLPLVLLGVSTLAALSSRFALW